MKQRFFFCSMLLLIRFQAVSGQISFTVFSSSSAFSLSCAHPSLLLSAITDNTSAPVSFSWFTPQQNTITTASITVSSPGTYTISYSSGSNSSFQLVVINSNTVAPTVTLQVPTATLSCKITTVLLTGNSSPANVQYTWMAPTVGMSCATNTCVAAMSGVYGLLALNPVNGCVGSATVSVQENNQVPFFDTVPLYTLSCPYGTVVLNPVITTATVNLSYTWKGPPGIIISDAGTPTLTAHAPGDYQVLVTDTLNGCMSNTIINVSSCTGTEDHQYSMHNVRVYPNPVKEHLRVETGLALKEGIRLIIQNITGQDVYRMRAVDNEFSVDTRWLPAGIYYAIIHSETGTAVFRIIKATEW